MTGFASASRPLLGVLGGMGPHATIDFLLKLLSVTKASCDQDHLPVITYLLPQIQDRSAAILAGAPSPLPAMRDALRLLEKAGAKYIAVPCNTAHFWFDELSTSTSVSLVNIVDAVIDEIERHKVFGKIALLGTEATAKSDIYRSRLERAGYELVLTDSRQQQVVNSVIHSIKAGELAQLNGSLDEVVADLSRNGATACILGCTELPLLRFRDFDGIFIDSTLALARACVALSGSGSTKIANTERPAENPYGDRALPEWTPEPSAEL